MGYYTRYELRTHPPLPHVCISTEYEYMTDEDGEFVDDAKWYDHVHDLRALSVRYPEVLITLVGIGESIRDVWCKHFKGVLSYKVSLALPPFDESKLK